MKVLLVDDSNVMRRLTKRCLISLEPEFVEAEDGLEAVEIYRNEKPDVVILDIVMPNIDGIETLKRILHFDQDAKVIMLTSIEKEPLLDEAMQLGAKAYIVKPPMKDQIIETVRNLLE